ncbi:YbaB/EbfC family nucleoid-associated protein [Nonomuraea cavernae]|uniref:YbaB/EbfC family nucleoid-associated protein n=1 Tax=Nonomuraea cavernae TaxID=2045107 RepID=UPI003400F907
MNGTRGFDLDVELARAARETERLRERIAEFEGSAETAGGLVAARVGPTGRLAELRLRPQTMRLGSEELAEAIVEAVGAAQDDLARQQREITADAVGDGQTGGPGGAHGPGRESTLRLLDDLDRLFGRL